ncbi:MULTISPECIES: nucleotide-binding domain-containing protein [Lactobacillaceae]|uniref:Adenylyl/Guanylyl and SMODS C-terminal sensor domain-containing protein n=2 Tax=Lactobacillales TaxID=186826 RepID=A0A5B7Y355_LEVBR|nr:MULTISPECIES: hypothetical protein [Lactobacillaceae]QCZ54435.1 hypothetical protein UCCLBBS449_pA0029 [Levilactobacillus brevis]
MNNECYKLKDVPIMSTRIFATETGAADNTEEFADEKNWNIRVQYYIEIEAEVERDGWRRCKLEEFVLIPYGRHVNIHFKVGISKEMNISQKIKWYWKIRNVGPIAIERNNIRGQIIKGNTEQVEHTLFPGNHYVEIYGVENKTVIAFGRREVPLREEVDKQKDIIQ